MFSIKNKSIKKVSVKKKNYWLTAKNKKFQN